GGEQHFPGFGAASVRRQMQRRIAERVRDVELGTGLDQDCNDLDIAVDRGIVHRGARFLVGLVRLGVLVGDEPADRLGVVLPRRAGRVAEIIAGAGGRGRGYDEQPREPENGRETSLHDPTPVAVKRVGAASQSSAAAMVSTAVPGSGGGRLSMMTGRPNS